MTDWIVLIAASIIVGMALAFFTGTGATVCVDGTCHRVKIGDWSGQHQREALR